MKLLCLSDIHGEAAGITEILPDATGVDAIIVAGDITHLGGREEAEKVLAPLMATGLRVFAVAGNMDRESVRESLAEKEIDLHARGVTLGRLGLMGLGGGTPSPFGTPWELADEEATACLEAGLADIATSPFKVLISHAPPRGTKIDKSFAGMHVGSEPVRKFLMSGAVDLCICGHIHEAAGEDTVGGALCVNIGPFKNGRYAIIEIDESGPHVSWRKR
jgi:uncharacterized protein